MAAVTSTNNEIQENSENSMQRQKMIVTGMSDIEYSCHVFRNSDCNKTRNKIMWNLIPEDLKKNSRLECF